MHKSRNAIITWYDNVLISYIFPQGITNIVYWKRKIIYYFFNKKSSHRTLTESTTTHLQTKTCVVHVYLYQLFKSDDTNPFNRSISMKNMLNLSIKHDTFKLVSSVVQFNSLCIIQPQQWISNFLITYLKENFQAD